MMAVALVAVGIFGSAPALTRICIISRSSAELASRKGVAPTVSSYPPAILGLRLGHARVRIGAVGQKSIHQLQLGLTIRNTAHRVDQTVHAVCRVGFPLRRRPMQRREARIADVGVGSVIEQEERQRDLAPYRSDEQRSVAVDARGLGTADLPTARAAPGTTPA